MGLDRSALANLDRRLLAELDREERYQMVRVPISAAKWSTWKRYCESAGRGREEAQASCRPMCTSLRVADLFGEWWGD